MNDIKAYTPHCRAVKKFQAVEKSLYTKMFQNTSGKGRYTEECI